MGRWQNCYHSNCSGCKVLSITVTACAEHKIRSNLKPSMPWIMLICDQYYPQDKPNICRLPQAYCQGRAAVVKWAPIVQSAWFNRYPQHITTPTRSNARHCRTQRRWHASSAHAGNISTVYTLSWQQPQMLSINSRLLLLLL